MKTMADRRSKPLKSTSTITEFTEGIEQLQKMGYITELWHSPKGKFTLIWTKKGAREQWRVTASDHGTHRAQLKQIGSQARLWVSAKTSATGDPNHFAVREV